MTYSDVITLMMTFFILLLTFATAEPEKFEQMQSTLFGYGRTGVAGRNRDGIDRDALVLRFRPQSGRMTSRGSEMPPANTDPLREAIGKGLAVLEEENPDAREQQVRFEIAASLFVGADKQLTPLARQHLGMLGRQMQRLPVAARLAVTSPDDVPAAVDAARSLSDLFQIHPSRISVAEEEADSPGSRLVRITVSRRSESLPISPQ